MCGPQHQKQATLAKEGALTQTKKKYGLIEDMRMLATVKYISSMWHFPGESGEAKPKYEMNALMLLANAIEALSQFNVLYQMPLDEKPEEPE